MTRPDVPWNQSIAVCMGRLALRLANHMMFETAEEVQDQNLTKN
jgi:hypothetical protein